MLDNRGRRLAMAARPIGGLVSRLYESRFQRLLYPAYETGLRCRHILSWFASHERGPWLVPTDILALQREQLKQLEAHCEPEASFYQRRRRELGVRVADIRCHFDELNAVSWRDRLFYRAIGGSTEELLRFGHTCDSNDRRTAVMWRGYDWTGSCMGRRALYLWAGTVGKRPGRAQQAKDRLYNLVFDRTILDGLQLSVVTLAKYVETINRYRPEIIVAYVAPLLRLAQWRLDNKRTIRRPRGMLGAAEALHEFQCALIWGGGWLPGIQQLRLPRGHADCRRMQATARPVRQWRPSSGRVDGATWSRANRRTW